MVLSYAVKGLQMQLLCLWQQALPGRCSWGFGAGTRRRVKYRALLLLDFDQDGFSVRAWAEVKKALSLLQ